MPQDVGLSLVDQVVYLCKAYQQHLKRLPNSVLEIKFLAANNLEHFGQEPLEKAITRRQAERGSDAISLRTLCENVLLAQDDEVLDLIGFYRDSPVLWPEEVWE